MRSSRCIWKSILICGEEREGWRRSAPREDKHTLVSLLDIEVDLEGLVGVLGELAPCGKDFLELRVVHLLERCGLDGDARQVGADGLGREINKISLVAVDVRGRRQVGRGRNEREEGGRALSPGRNTFILQQQPSSVA